MVRKAHTTYYEGLENVPLERNSQIWKKRPSFHCKSYQKIQLSFFSEHFLPSSVQKEVWQNQDLDCQDLPSVQKEAANQDLDHDQSSISLSYLDLWSPRSNNVLQAEVKQTTGILPTNAPGSNLVPKFVGWVLDIFICRQTY